MAIKDVRLSEDEYAFATISSWSEQLEIPVASLLHHAAMGALRVFFRAHQVRCEYVDTSGLDIAAFEVEIPPSLPRSALLKPLYTDSTVFDIRLDSTQCAALALGQTIRVPFFSGAAVKGSPWVLEFDSESDRWGRELPPTTRISSFSSVPPTFLDPKESSGGVAAEQLRSRWNRTSEEFQRTPVAHRVTPNDVLIKDVEIRKFLDSLTSYEFISDLYHEAFLVDELPGYVSEKLLEMTIVNEVIWKNLEKLDRQGIDAKAARAIKHLEGDFKRWCPRTSSPDGLVAFAALTCNPTIRRSSEHPNVTPNLLALLTASKLYWSPAHVGLDRNETLPNPDGVKQFLRFMGMTDGNEAASGAVVIRPNDAINYVPRSKKTESAPTTIDEVMEARRRQHLNMLVDSPSTDHADSSDS